MRIYLASDSRRRYVLMQRLGLDFDVLSPKIDETLNLEDVKELVLVLARAKAEDVIKRNDLTSGIVIGADTVGTISNEILGKPKSQEDAVDLLKKMSGRSHYVYTGIYVIDLDKNREREHLERTKVTFFDLSDEDINNYIQTGEYRDKAGSYGIQGKGGLLVRSIEGDYYNVVGLPIARLRRMLRELGV